MKDLETQTLLFFYSITVSYLEESDKNINPLYFLLNKTD